MANRLNITLRAFHRLRERNISEQEVEAALSEGSAIEEYPEDTPLPSQLYLGFPGGRALHVVAAWDQDVLEWRILTAYWPDPELWEPGYRTRKQP